MWLLLPSSRDIERRRTVLEFNGAFAVSFPSTYALKKVKQYHREVPRYMHTPSFKQELMSPTKIQTRYELLTGTERSSLTGIVTDLVWQWAICERWNVPWARRHLRIRRRTKKKKLWPYWCNANHALSNIYRKSRKTEENKMILNTNAERPCAEFIYAARMQEQKEIEMRITPNDETGKSE